MRSMVVAYVICSLVIIAVGIQAQVTADDRGSCYQGWIWLSGQCYTVVYKAQTWTDANQHCMSSNNGRMVQFDDISQQTEVQTKLLTDSKDAFWIGLKANGTGWAWTNGKSNQHNSFKQEVTKDAINNGHCVIMNGRYWYKRNCNSSNYFVCQAPTIECKRENDWIITYNHHCIRIEHTEQTWHAAREYCEQNNSDLVMLDDYKEQEFVKNLSLSNEMWIGLYYNDTVKSFVWVNGSIGYSVGSNHLHSFVVSQCVAFNASVSLKGDPWIHRSCDRKMGFICERNRDNRIRQTTLSNENTYNLSTTDESISLPEMLVTTDSYSYTVGSTNDKEYDLTTESTSITVPSALKDMSTSHMSTSQLHVWDDVSKFETSESNDLSTTHTHREVTTNLGNDISTTMLQNLRGMLPSITDSLNDVSASTTGSMNHISPSTTNNWNDMSSSAPDVWYERLTATVFAQETISKNRFNVTELQRTAYKVAHGMNLQCNHNGMSHMLYSMLRIFPESESTYNNSDKIFKILLQVLDSAFENDTGSFLQKCFQTKESAVLVEPFIRAAITTLNITSEQYLHFPNLDYKQDFVMAANISRNEYHFGNVFINNVHSGLSKTDDKVALSMIVLHFKSNSTSIVAEIEDSIADGNVGYYKHIIGPVLSLTAYTTEARISLHHTFTIDLNSDEQKMANASVSNIKQCVFYDERQSLWSEYGCTKLEDRENKSTCTCNHTTSFAILMQVTDVQLDDIHVLVLDVITYIGCCISILTQLITLTVFTCVGSLSSERVFVHRNLCIAIICAQFGFLSGIQAVKYQIVCAIVAIILHYFYTSVFVWMLVEGLLLYSKVVQVFGTEKSRVTYFCMFGWGVPLVLVAVSASANWSGYGTPTSCWLSTKSGAIWAFVGPAVAIILVNIVILWMVIKIVISSAKHEQRTEYNQIRAGVKGALILIPLLGLTWIFGLMAVNEDLVIFQYLFAIFNSLQGFFIFLFHCVLNSELIFISRLLEVRQALKRLRERQQLLRGDFTSLTSGSSRSSSSKQKILKHDIRINCNNSNGTNSTRLGSKQSIRSSKLSDDIMIQDLTEEDIGLSYI